MKIDGFEKIKKRAEEFCSECISGDMYDEKIDYDDYYNEEEYEEIIKDCQWIKEFKEFLEHAVGFSHEGMYNEAAELFELIFNTLRECEDNEELLGRDYPLDYIEINKEQIYQEYFKSMIISEIYGAEVYNKIAEMYWRIGVDFKWVILKNVTDTDQFYEAVVQRIKVSSEWYEQRALFYFLHEIKEIEPEEQIEMAEKFLKYNERFKEIIENLK